MKPPDFSPYSCQGQKYHSHRIALNHLRQNTHAIHDMALILKRIQNTNRVWQEFWEGEADV
jgi:hypothetical protein